MGLFHTPKIPQPNIILPPPAAHPPTLASAFSSVFAQEKTAKTAEGKGVSGTVKTSPRGVSSAPATAKTTLLGD